MFTLERLNSFQKALLNIIEQPTKSLAQYKFDSVFKNFETEFNFFFSLMFEFSKINFSTIKTEKDEFNFEKEIGKLVYLLLENKSNMFKKEVTKLPYSVQIILYYFLSHKIKFILSEQKILTTITKYYKISDILSIVEIPEIIETTYLPIQGLDRKNVEKISLPVYFYKPNQKFLRFGYLLKVNGKIISNISSMTIRKEIENIIPYDNYGVIGVLVKQKKYKRKYNFEILYFNSDYKNVKLFYQNKGENKNNIEKLSFIKNNSLIKIVKPKLIKTEEELLHRLKKTKGKFVLIGENFIQPFRLQFKYDFAKVVDYIYNDDFDVIGLKVFYNDIYYNLYFNVENTSYIYNIEDRFIKIGVLEFNGQVVKIVFNGEVKMWHHTYKHCIFCKSLKYRHHSKGVCNSCWNKLETICNNISGKFKEPCDIIFNTIIDNVEIKGDGNELTFTPLPEKQLLLPFNKQKFCKKDTND